MALEVSMITTLEEAMKRIAKLEEENATLKSELESYRGRKFAGRQKHDETWMESYNDFALKYENGRTIMDIVAEGKISRRTAYRYKAYYDELNGLKKNEQFGENMNGSK